MSKTATHTSTWTLSGDGITSSDAATTSNTSGFAPTSLVFSGAAFSAVTFPGTVNGLRIVPPPGNTQTLTLKGITGDTGIPIAVAKPTYLDFTGVVSPAMGITAGGAVTLLLEWC